MVSVATLGYPSKRAAIDALLDDGKPHAEIARLCDTSEQAVYVRVSERRKEAERGVMTDARMKALRIYSAALRVMAEAQGLTPVMLHAIISRVLFKDLEALDAIALRDAEAQEPATTAEEDSGDDAPEPVAAPQPRQTKIAPGSATKLVTLQDPDTLVYLNLDGSGVTRDRQHMYRGTAQQAQKMRDSSSFAKMMVVKTFFVPQRP